MIDHGDRFKSVRFTIDCEMKLAQAVAFHEMLRKMESLGRSGSSRIVGFYADGDGAFQPKFKSTFVSGETVRPLSNYLKMDDMHIYDEDSVKDNYDVGVGQENDNSNDGGVSNG